MENSPQNVRYLRLSSLILSIISIVLFALAYYYLPKISEMGLVVCLPSLCIIALGLLALINAFYTFKFSTDINEDSFVMWQVVQHKFWANTIISLVILGFASFFAAMSNFGPAS